MLDNTPNQPTKFRTKNWVEINDDARGIQIKFKISMLKSSFCDYSDAHILVSGTITIAELAAGGGNNKKKVTFKICAPFTDCISEINKTQVNNVEDINIVMSMYNLIEYSNNYLKTSGRYGNIEVNHL